MKLVTVLLQMVPTVPGCMTGGLPVSSQRTLVPCSGWVNSTRSCLIRNVSVSVAGPKFEEIEWQAREGAAVTGKTYEARRVCTGSSNEAIKLLNVTLRSWVVRCALRCRSCHSSKGQESGERGDNGRGVHSFELGSE